MTRRKKLKDFSDGRVLVLETEHDRCFLLDRQGTPKILSLQEALQLLREEAATDPKLSALPVTRQEILEAAILWITSLRSRPEEKKPDQEQTFIEAVLLRASTWEEQLSTDPQRRSLFTPEWIRRTAKQYQEQQKRCADPQKES